MQYPETIGHRTRFFFFFFLPLYLSTKEMHVAFRQREKEMKSKPFHSGLGEHCKIFNSEPAASRNTEEKIKFKVNMCVLGLSVK